MILTNVLTRDRSETELSTRTDTVTQQYCRSWFKEEQPVVCVSVDDHGSVEEDVETVLCPVTFSY